MARKPTKPPLHDPESIRKPYVHQPRQEVIPPTGLDFVALLRKLSAAPYSKEIAHAKSDVILMAAMEQGEFSPAQKVIEFQARLAGFLIDRMDSNVTITLTPEQRQARILELVQKAGYLPKQKAVND